MLLLLLVLLGVGVLTVGGTALLMAWAVLRPPRMSDSKAIHVLGRLVPADVGLEFESVQFEVRDERTAKPLKLSAWWMETKHDSSITVVLLHGYADAKVGALAWAPSLHALGCNILALDLRAHGDSDGTSITGGCAERNDVDAVINQLRAARLDQTQHLLLFGVSLGAAVAALVARERDDIAGVILDSPFADFREALIVHGRLFGMPGGLVSRLAWSLTQLLAGCDFSRIRPADLVRRMPCPVLVIHGTEDPFAPPAVRNAFEQAIAHRTDGISQSVRVEGAGHLHALYTDPRAYTQRLAEFIAAVCDRS